MSQGFVYILTNEAMPGLVKIGRTSRDVDLRASELWQTGVPQKFEVFWSCKTPDCIQLEAYVHGDLRKHRVSKSREFFKVDEFKAQERVRFWAQIQADEWAKDTFSEFNAVHYSEACAAHAVQRLAVETSLRPFLISQAFALITADELAPAIDRAKEEARRDQIESFKRIGIPEDEWKDLLDE